MSLLDNLQDRIDTLALSVFQAVHTTSTNTDSESVDKSIETLRSNYSLVLDAIDSLEDRTPEQQVQLMSDINAEYAATRERILHLEAQLKAVLSKTELKMEELVTRIEETQPK